MFDSFQTYDACRSVCLVMNRFCSPFRQEKLLYPWVYIWYVTIPFCILCVRTYIIIFNYVLDIYSTHWCVHDSLLQCNLYDQGEVEESAQFKTELERISCSRCCSLAGTRDFTQKVSLKGTNITRYTQCVNTCLAPNHAAIYEYERWVITKMGYANSVNMQ